MLSLYATLVESRGFEVFIVMENSDEYKRHVVYFLFKSGENAAEKLNIVHGEQFISIKTTKKWLERLKKKCKHCGGFASFSSAS